MQSGTTRRNYLKMAGTVSVGSLAGCLGSVGGGTSGPLKVGLMAPLSGPQGVYGESLEQGAGLAEIQLNNGNSPVFDSISDREINLILEDTGGDPGTGTEKATKLATDDNVDVFTGVVNSSVAAGVSTIASREDIPFLISVAGAEPLTGENCNKQTFGLYLDTYQLSVPIVPYMMENLGDNLFLMGNDYDFPRSANEFLREEVTNRGGSIAGETYVPLGTSDFSTTISSIRESGADVVWAAVVGADAISFMNQATNSGLKDEVEIATPSTAVDEPVIGGAKLAGVGVHALCNWHFNIDISPEINNAFLSGMEDEYGVTRPAQYAITQWEGLHIYSHAVAAAGSTESSDVISELEGLKWQSFNGQKTLRETDHSTKQNVIIQRLEEPTSGELPNRVTADTINQVESPDNCTF